MPNKEEEKKKTDLVIGCILALALLVRMIAINQSFWLDEAINVTAARDRGFTDLILNYTKGDFHPPLYHIILWLWLKAVPVSEMSARLPSVVFGVLTVWVVYKIGQKLWKENASFARLAALFLATSGLHVYYSQEARMYALAALTTASAVLTLLNLRKDSSRKNKLLFLSSFVLMLLSDYQPWLLLPFFFVVTPGMTALALFLLFPWWPMLAEQVRQGITTAANFPAWGEVVGGLTLKSALLVPVKFLVGRVSIDNNLLYALVLSLPTVVAGLGLARTLMEKGKHLHVIKGWLAVPLAVPLEAVLFLKYCPAVVPTAARTSSTKPAIATIPTAPTAISSMATPTTPLTSKVVESVKESSAVEITTTAPLWAASAPLLIKSILKLRCSLRCVASALSGKASVWLTGSSDRPIDGRLNSLIVLYS